MVKELLPVSATLGSIPCILPKNSQGKIDDVAEVYQGRWVENSGQYLENVDQTYLVLASGKLVLQKIQLKVKARI